MTAFSHNLSLREILLNANLDHSNFSEEVFEGCVNLKRIGLSGEVFEVENLIGAMDSHSGEPRIIKSIAKSVYHSMQIEDGVLNKFSINLKKIVVPEGITAIGKKPASIGDRCFDECLSLDVFDFSGIGVIGERAFERCDSLKSVKLGFVECGFHAFADCSGLEQVEISSDTVLKSGVFIGCTQVRTVVLDGQSYEHCRSCEAQPCMRDCPRALHIPEEIERVYRLIMQYGKT